MRRAAQTVGERVADLPLRPRWAMGEFKVRVRYGIEHIDRRDRGIMTGKADALALSIKLICKIPHVGPLNNPCFRQMRCKTYYFELSNGALVESAFTQHSGNTHNGISDQWSVYNKLDSVQRINAPNPQRAASFLFATPDL